MKKKFKIYLARQVDATLTGGYKTNTPAYQRFQIEKIEGGRSVFGTREWTVGDAITGEEADQVSRMNITIFTA